LRTASATSRPRAAAHDRDQRPQVRGDAVARLGPDVLEVEGRTVRHAGGGVAIDGPEVDVQAGRKPDGVLEADAPVDERHVQVERARVPGVDGEPDLAHRQLARLTVRGEGDVAAGEGGDDHRQDRERALDGLDSARGPCSARVGFVRACSSLYGDCH
jgi:hypothetical protein